MKRKGTITEGDVAELLRRYSATTVLTLLQEVSKCASENIDWNSLVKNTATGITNAREYQTLWRHLAYCTTLLDAYEDEGQPLDDDSDLEFEIEPSPPVGAEALAEAAACVKVLEASGIPDSSSQASHSIVEAPLTINVPSSTNVSDVRANNQQSTTLTQGMNITVPISIQKQPLPIVSSSEGIDGNASTSSTQPVRRKRKLWTLEEDKELIAAVHKCGEGNWSTILKGAFKHDRTASQLSQRWALIRKRPITSNYNYLGNYSISCSASDALQCTMQPLAVAGSTASTIGVNASAGSTMTVAANSTEATVVTMPSSSMMLPMDSTALGTPFAQSTAGTGLENFASDLSQGQSQEQGSIQGAVGSSSVAHTLLSARSRPKAKKTAANKSSTGRLISSMPPPATTATTTSVSPPTKTGVSLPVASTGSRRYGNASATRPVTTESLGHVNSKALSGPHPMVQAAAVAAGARIYPPPAAASLLKAAQSGNVVHIGVGGVSFSKSGYATQPGMICGMADSIRSPAGSSGMRASSAAASSMRAPNVHYIRSRLNPSPPVYSGITPSVQRLPASQPKGHMVKPIIPSQSIPHSSKSNLLSAATLPPTQASESNSASQAQALNQVDCSPSSNPVLINRSNLKSQTGPSVTEASQSVQSDINLKPPLSDINFPMPNSTTNQMPAEKGAFVSPKASALPLVEVCEASSSLPASGSLCQVAGPCQFTDFAGGISSITTGSDNAIVNDGVTVQEDKIIKLETNNSSLDVNDSFQNQACSERSMLGENAAGIERVAVKAKIEVYHENNNEKDTDIGCMPGPPPVASDQNVSSSAENVPFVDPSVESAK